MDTLPVRDTVLSVLLSKEERERLAVFAGTRDLRLSQAARQILNERLTASTTNSQNPLDGAH